MPHVSNADRPDPIAGIMEVTRNAESEMRRKDRVLGRTLVIGRAYLASTVLIVILAAMLLLPHSDGVRGIDVLFFTDAAADQSTSLPSHIFVLLYSVGTIGFGALMILTQKWWAAGVAWSATCVSAVYGILAIWLRQSGRGPDPDFQGFGGPGIGMYLSEILLFLLIGTLAGVLWTRTPEQRQLEENARSGDGL
ncbi:Rv2732c family membrane protein [Dietzia sp. NPDC055343]